MGKKNKYNKLGYFGKQQADKEMAEQYGIDVSEYGNEGRPGENYDNKKSYDDLKQDIARAASNDYDLRRSIEAAQQSGNKKAQKIGSISNASEAYAATRFMAKTHKNRMGNTGEYGSANDQGNVTNYWVNKDRSKLADAMSPQEQQAEAEQAPVELSTELQDAKEKVQAFENKKYDIFKSNDTGSTQTALSDGDDQRKQAAGSFLDKYKLDVKANISPVLPV